MQPDPCRPARRHRLLGCALLALAGLAAPRPVLAAEAPNVVASILPVHSLVAGVMEGVGTPHLIVPGGRSPHSFSMRPSDAEALQEADAVVWVGPGLETFLEPALETLADDARHVMLGQADGLVTLPVREDEAFEKHVHDHGHDHGDEHAHEDDHGHDHGDEHAHEDDHGHDHSDEHAHADADAHDRDWHLWLDPHNGGVMVRAIAKALAQVDPDHAETYRANAESLAARLDIMTDDIAARLDPVRDRPFIVFHDAYQYFENRFGVGAAGAIMVQPETPPGAARVTDIRERITQAGAVCVFTEPQFEPRLARVIIEGTEARLGTLDPLGAGLEPGPGLYPTLIRSLADDMLACLGEG